MTHAYLTLRVDYSHPLCIPPGRNRCRGVCFTYKVRETHTTRISLPPDVGEGLGVGAKIRQSKAHLR